MCYILLLLTVIRNTHQSITNLSGVRDAGGFPQEGSHTQSSLCCLHLTSVAAFSTETVVFIITSDTPLSKSMVAKCQLPSWDSNSGAQGQMTRRSHGCSHRASNWFCMSTVGSDLLQIILVVMEAENRQFIEELFPWKHACFFYFLFLEFEIWHISPFLVFAVFILWQKAILKRDSSNLKKRGGGSLTLIYWQKRLIGQNCEEISFANSPTVELN